MRTRNPEDMRPRGARAWQDAQDDDRYDRGRRTQAYGRAWDRDREQARQQRDAREEAFEPGERAGYGAARGDDRDAGYTASGAYGGRMQGYTPARGYASEYEDDDFDSAAWPRSGRRDFGPGGYGSGASFEREPGAGDYGRREYGERHDTGYAGQGMYASEPPMRGRSFNDRWENAYRGPGYAGSAYGGAAGYASAQRQGYGREPMAGLGRRGLGPKNYTRSDERIREDVSERLSDDDQLDASEIEVQVSQGTVTLTGTVETRWEKHRAEDIADSCSGVRDVHNQVRVGSSMQSSSASPQSTGTSVGSGVGATRESVQGGDAPLSGGASRTPRPS